MLTASDQRVEQEPRTAFQILFRFLGSPIRGAIAGPGLIPWPIGKPRDRLEEIFEMMKKPARGTTCDAIIGIIEEGKEIMEEYAGERAPDAGLADQPRQSSTMKSRVTGHCELRPRNSE